MPRFRKKPVVVEAVRWTGLNVRDITAFCKPLVELNADGGEPALYFVGRSRVEPHKNVVRIRTPEGVMTADAGDWVIRGVKGEFYPCKPDIFAATYEPAE